MSLQLFVLDKIIRFQMKRRFEQRPDILQLRAMMSTMARRPSRVPAHVAVEATRLDGVPTERVARHDADTRAAVLYLHGGAFVAGSPVAYRALTWRIADALAVPVHVVDYRLAPEHPFPAGLDDALAAYRALRKAGAERIVVGGDSAGGNLTLALALRLKELGEAPPAALVCLSPATDLVADFPSHTENARSDAMLDPRLRAGVVAHYCPGADATHPLISPLRGDVAGLPPTLIHCSGVEMLRDDGVLMGEKLRAAGVPVRLSVWADVFHVWHLSADFLPEARRAIRDVVSFARPHLGGQG